jgi:hypothetical protein
MKRVLSALCTLAAVAVFSGSVQAVDDPQQSMPGKLLLIKSGKLAKFIAKPISPAVFALPTGPNEPTTAGGTLRLQELVGVAELSTTGTFSASLPSGGWKGLGNPAGSKGFKYSGAGSSTDPCKTVLVKPKIVKGICKGVAVDFNQPVSGEVAVALTLGSASKPYCTTFGGTEIKNDGTLLKRKDATGAGACTCGAGNPGTFTFKNNLPVSSDCGDIITAAGVSSNLACNGLYIGSGSGTLTLPETNPTSVKALVMDVSCCTGDTLLLSASTSTGTGDIETCTSAGCKFGAPLPLPNPMSPATSTCVFNTYQQDVVGEANCATGDARLDAPLFSRTFLTGDILPRRCSGGTNAGALCSPLGVSPQCTGGGTCVNDPDLQPCPICNPTTLKCNGGFNGMDDGNQLSCVPDGGLGQSDPQFPTSHTCGISTLVLVGDLPVPFLLSSGTQTDVAVPSGTQQRVFCGHCRDVALPGGTGAFGLCTGGANNGMSCAVSGDCPLGTCSATPCESDADCAGDVASRETCEQRNEGAFGPGGGANKTITEIGTPAGNLDDFAAHQGTLVSVFCIPPSFNAIIDGAADIPGPGAVSLPGLFDVNSPSGAFLEGKDLF